jgi:hypothetical protein
VLFHTFQHFLQVRNTGADHDIIVVNGVTLNVFIFSVGMLMAAKLSALEGFITDKEVQQIEYLLQKVNLPITISSKIDYQDFPVTDFVVLLYQNFFPMTGIIFSGLLL